MRLLPVAVILSSCLGFIGTAQAVPISIANGVWSATMVRDCRSPGNFSDTPDRCMNSNFLDTRRQYTELYLPGYTTAETYATHPFGVLGSQASGARVETTPGTLAPPVMHHGAFTSNSYARTSGNLLAVQGFNWDGTGDSHRSLSINLDYSATHVTPSLNDLELTGSTDAASMLYAVVQVFSLDTSMFQVESDAYAATPGACIFDFGLIECLSATRSDFQLEDSALLRAFEDSAVLTDELEFNMVAGRHYFIYLQSQALARFGAYMDATHTLITQFNDTSGLALAPDGVVPEPEAWALFLAGLMLLSRLRRQPGHPFAG